jgi:GNAT superfamily N-acetyltransferase
MKETDHIYRTKIPGLVLRFATIKDIPLILAFIRELAEYEKLSPEVVADENILRQSLFNNHPVAEVILAEYKARPSGFCLFFHNFSTFIGKPGLYIEDLFVRPEYRSRGIGQAILTFIARIAIDRGCGRVEWWVLDWNQRAIDFYKKIGARAMDEWTVFRLTGDSLSKLAEDD